MSVSTGHGCLRRASKDLLARWHETKQTWRDENSRQFEEKHLKPLLASLQSAEAAIGHMDLILAKVRADCE